MHTDDDELARILDEGIAGYGDAEPREGLAGRIIGRVRKGARRRWAVRMGVGLAVAAGVMMILPGRSEKTEKRPRAAVAIVVTAASAKVPTEVRLASLQVKVHARRRGSLTKKAVFPTPAPLTPEERGLMALLKHEGSLPALESLRDGDNKVDIPEIVIPPIEKAEEEK